MPSILIRDLSQETKDALKRRSGAHKRSMEEEARQILNAALKRFIQPAPALSFGEKIHARFAALGGVELEALPRSPMRPLPVF